MIKITFHPIILIMIEKNIKNKPIKNIITQWIKVFKNCQLFAELG